MKLASSWFSQLSNKATSQGPVLYGMSLLGRDFTFSIAVELIFSSQSLPNAVLSASFPRVFCHFLTSVIASQSWLRFCSPGGNCLDLAMSIYHFIAAMWDLSCSHPTLSCCGIWFFWNAFPLHKTFISGALFLINLGQYVLCILPPLSIAKSWSSGLAPGILLLPSLYS